MKNSKSVIRFTNKSEFGHIMRIYKDKGWEPYKNSSDDIPYDSFTVGRQYIEYGDNFVQYYWTTYIDNILTFKEFLQKERVAIGYSSEIESILPQGKDDKSELFQEDGKTKEDDTLEEILERMPYWFRLYNAKPTGVVNKEGYEPVPHKWTARIDGKWWVAKKFSEWDTAIEAIVELGNRLSNNK